MTCKDCLEYDKCKKESEKNEYMKRKMWQLDFWENAEERCAKFKEKGSDDE